VSSRCALHRSLSLRQPARVTVSLLCVSCVAAAHACRRLGACTEYRQHLVEVGLLFDNPDAFQIAAGLGRDWPDGRGVYVGQDKDLAGWVNDEDHLQLVTISKGVDFEAYASEQSLLYPARRHMRSVGARAVAASHAVCMWQQIASGARCPASKTGFAPTASHLRTARCSVTSCPAQARSALGCS
jgi:hypothetical protein